MLKYNRYPFSWTVSIVLKLLQTFLDSIYCTLASTDSSVASGTEKYEWEISHSWWEISHSCWK